MHTHINCSLKHEKLKLMSSQYFSIFTNNLTRLLGVKKNHSTSFRIRKSCYMVCYESFANVPMIYLILEATKNDYF